MFSICRWFLDISSLSSHCLNLAACDIGWFDCNDANYEYYCIKNFLQCDGIDNCPNKNDEKDCPGKMLQLFAIDISKTV